MLMRNPLYLIIVLLAVQIVGAMCGGAGTIVRFSLWRIGLTILLFSTFFNFLFVHVGTTVLWRWPLSWPYVGGAMTVEAAVFGAINGLVLLTLLATFLTFNSIVPVGDLVRLIPAAFRDLGVVLLIALTYVPETIAHWHSIREAQAIRGHEVQGSSGFSADFYSSTDWWLGTRHEFGRGDGGSGLWGDGGGGTAVCFALWSLGWTAPEFGGLAALFLDWLVGVAVAGLGSNGVAGTDLADGAWHKAHTVSTLAVGAGGRRWWRQRPFCLCCYCGCGGNQPITPPILH